VESESDEKAAGEPASEAMVWGAPSLFVHVTVVPVFTVREEGSNAKFLIEIVFPPPVEAGGAAGVDGAGPEEQPATVQARITRTVQAMRNSMRGYADIIP
jgi:hypothetical protein